MCKKLLCLFFYVLAYHNLTAQTYNFVNYTTKNGLSNSSVYSIYQDKLGYIWAATENGLNRFDGNQFISYDLSNGLSENICLSIAEKENGTILVGTFSKGISEIYNNTIANAVVDPFKGQTVSKLIYSNSIIYFSNQTSIGFYDFKNKKTSFISSTIYNIKDIYDIYKYENNVYIATDNGLYILNTKSNSLSKKINKEITSIKNDNDGNLWLASTGVIYRINKQNYAILDSTVFDNDRKNKIDCFFIDSRNNIWFSTILPIGLFKISKKNDKLEIENVSAILNIGDTEINGIIEDDEKNVWIATYNKGLFCIKNSFCFINNEFKDNPVYSVFIDAKKNTYVANFHGITIIDSLKKIKESIIAKKNAREYCYGFYKNKTNIFYLTNGTYKNHFNKSINGIDLYTIASRTLFFINDSVSVHGTWLNSVYICNFLNKKFNIKHEIILDKNITKNNRVNKLVLDKQNTLWCASDLGLYKINLKTLLSQKVNHILCNGKINDILIDKQNELWLATENGLIKYNNGSPELIEKINTTSLGKTTSLATDKNNKLYIGTLKGLFVLYNHNAVFINDKTGLCFNEINKLFYDSIKNTMYLSTNDSYSEFDIDKFEQTNLKKLDVIVNSVFVMDKAIPFSSLYRIDYKKNNVRLEYVAICLSNPESVFYQYQIDEGVFIITQNTSLSLAGLSYGIHTITIKASTDKIYWGTPKVIKILVSTPFYATTWFYITLCVVVALLIYLYVKYKINDVRKKAEEKNTLQKQLNDLKFTALNASINPHFIFNALNSIQNYINHNDRSKASNYLGKFARLIRLILDKANDKEITIKEEIERLTYYMQLEQDRFNQSFTYSIEASTNIYHYAIPNMILQPLIENSILHGIKNMKDGLITVRFKVENQIIYLEVEDNGVGYDTNQIQNNTEHKSIAINNVKERLSLYPHSSYIVVSDFKNKKGTKTSISIHLV